MITLEDIKTDFILDELKKRGYIMVFWTREDVEHAISEFGQESAPEIVTAIVETIEKYFDASIGISWDTIGQYVHEYFNPQNEG